MADGPEAVALTRLHIALVGNPNTGKTTLFNRLTGLRAHTANYPGVTVDIRKGVWRTSNSTIDVSDLPGLYSLEAISPEETITRRALSGELGEGSKPDVVVIVVDSTNVQRNLFLASEIRDLDLPTVVVLNLIDAARAAGTKIDSEKLSKEMKCPVVPVSAKTGEGIEALAIELAAISSPALPLLESDHTSCTVGCSGCSFAARYDWAERTASSTVTQPDASNSRVSFIDKATTSPVLGPAIFLTMMLGVFYLIFSMASVPMDLVDSLFGMIGDSVSRLIPEEKSSPAVWFGAVGLLSMLTFAAGYKLAKISWSAKSSTIAIVVSVLVAVMPAADFHSLMVDGIVGGIGGVVIFLPQICILFFMITLLEDSGYMARAAFVMERMMRFVGLPGKAFVPMLSAHACAIPGIMATRAIENWRDRLVTILVLPLLTCSARLPVYSMLAALLFSDSPLKAAAVFTFAYVLGIVATLFSAWALKKTILKGESQPMVLELPPYRLPSLRSALYVVFDRAKVFLTNAGSVILMISVALWAMATYPRMSDAQFSQEAKTRIANLQQKAEEISADASLGLKNAGITEGLPTDEIEVPAEVTDLLAMAAEKNAAADDIAAQERLAFSVVGRLGKATEPIFRPLGFDWRINIGVMTSFAAREVIVSTLAIVYGIGEDGAEDDSTLVETLRRQKHPDGRAVFTVPTCLSLLVFYVLAMQCLPTQAVTKRETGSWKWAIFQFVYMTVMAYVAALATFQIAQATLVS